MASQIAATTSEPVAVTPLGIAAPLVGWLVPGAGHLMQRRYVRGLLIFISVVALFVLGVQLQGKVYAPNTGDILDMLGFLGDLGSGGLYLLTKTMGWGRTSIEFASADYGTKYMVIAGLLNLIAAVDAHHIAIGKKN